MRRTMGRGAAHRQRPSRRYGLGTALAGSASSNEDTLWSGYPHDTNLPVSAETMEHCRALVAEHRFQEAQEIIEREALGDFTNSYMPAGTLHMNFLGLSGSVTEYCRDLDLRSASASVSFCADGVHYIREYFASYPDNGIIMRFTADQPGKISLRLAYDSPLLHRVDIVDSQMVASMRCPSRVAPHYLRTCPDPIHWESEDGHVGMRGWYDCRAGAYRRHPDLGEGYHPD